MIIYYLNQELIQDMKSLHLCLCFSSFLTFFFWGGRGMISGKKILVFRSVLCSAVEFLSMQQKELHKHTKNLQHFIFWTAGMHIQHIAVCETHTQRPLISYCDTNRHLISSILLKLTGRSRCFLLERTRSLSTSPSSPSTSSSSSLEVELSSYGIPFRESSVTPMSIPLAWNLRTIQKCTNTFRQHN